MFTDRLKIKRHDSKSIQKRWSSKVRLDRFKLADIAVPIKDHPTSFLILTNINTQIFCPRVSFVDSFKPALQRNIPSYIAKLLFSNKSPKKANGKCILLFSRDIGKSDAHSNTFNDCIDSLFRLDQRKGCLEW